MEKSEKIISLKKRIKSLEKAERECSKSESELRRSQSKLHQMQQIARIGQWEFNFKNSDLTWSEGVYSIFDEDPKKFKVTYKSFLDLIHPEDRKFVDGSFTQSVMKKSPFNISFRLFLKDKSVKYVISICKNYYDDSGNPVRSLGTIQDVTKLKNIEIDLRRSEQKMGAIFNASPDIILLLDINGIILSSNGSFAKRMGLKLEDSVGKSVFDYCSPESIPGRKAALEKVFRTGKPLKIEDRGLTGLFESHVHPVFNQAGEVTEIAVYAHDITGRKQVEEELRKSESKLRNIFENSTNLFYSHTTDHIITYISPQVKDILGYTPEEAMVKWTDFISDNPENEIGFQNTIKAIKTGETQPPYKLELVRINGEKIWVEVREVPQLKNGKTVAIVGSLNEITDRLKAEEEILRLKNGLEVQVAEKTKELNEKISELERFFDATVDRELKLEELYRENEKLKAELKKNE